MSTAWWGPTSAKTQFLRRLHKRVGHPFLLSFDSPFQFEMAGERWRNVDQLAAVVEFYANFQEPWGAGQVPRKPGDPGYVAVDFRDPSGTAATAAGTVIHLDGEPDLSEIVVNPAANPVVGAPADPGYPQRLRYLYDTLSLAGDRSRPSRTFRIMSVDDVAKTVTVDAAPVLTEATSAWRINRRPILVIIDPLGPRVRGPFNLSGANATVVGPDPLDATRSIVQLVGVPAANLARINQAFDTIELPGDTSTSPNRPGPVYRIVSVDAATQRITIVGAPTFDGGSSAWGIPAGVGGTPPPLAYNLSPQYPPAVPNAVRFSRGFDHYDAALFIIHRDRVVGPRAYRWSSYTSRDQGPWDGPGWQESLSSLRGNARYWYSAYRSGGIFKNYTFGVIDARPSPGGLTPAPPHTTPPPDLIADTIADARFYAGTPSPPAAGALGAALDPSVMADPNGKSLIRLHRGSQGDPAGWPGTGSNGCLVSPEYVDMRSELVRRYEDEYRVYYGPHARDAEVHKLLQFATTNAGSEALYNGALPAPNAGVTLTDGNWADRLAGPIWVIRPDERPLGP
jgi:hypothetical protein